MKIEEKEKEKSTTNVETQTKKNTVSNQNDKKTVIIYTSPNSVENRNQQSSVSSEPNWYFLFWVAFCLLICLLVVICLWCCCCKNLFKSDDKVVKATPKPVQKQEYMQDHKKSFTIVNNQMVPYDDAQKEIEINHRQMQAMNTDRDNNDVEVGFQTGRQLLKSPENDHFERSDDENQNQGS